MRSTGWKDLIDIGTAIQGGRPVVKGRRVPLYVLIEQVAHGLTLREAADACKVAEQDVRAALLFAAHNLQRRRSRVPNIAESNPNA
jgi:uncharacterized protein (DUF433 family)